ACVSSASGRSSRWHAADTAIVPKRAAAYSIFLIITIRFFLLNCRCTLLALVSIPDTADGGVSRSRSIRIVDDAIRTPILRTGEHFVHGRIRHILESDDDFYFRLGGQTPVAQMNVLARFGVFIHLHIFLAVARGTLLGRRIGGPQLGSNHERRRYHDRVIGSGVLDSVLRHARPPHGVIS